EDYVGLFGRTNNAGAIQNIHLRNVSILGDDLVGALVGEKRGAGVVTDCDVTGTVTGDANVGGLLGENTGGGSVSDCWTNVTVSGRTDVGGLIGDNARSVTDCYADGDVVASGDDVGGLIGSHIGGAVFTVLRCHATGNVTGVSQDIGGRGLVSKNQ
ncbi:unnamed protein product, partial [marine sediment metagenome]